MTQQTDRHTAYKNNMQVHLFDASSSGCALPGSLGSELLTRSLATGRFASSLFGTCHLGEVEAERAMESLEQNVKWKQRNGFAATGRSFYLEVCKLRLQRLLPSTASADRTALPAALAAIQVASCSTPTSLTRSFCCSYAHCNLHKFHQQQQAWHPNLVRRNPPSLPKRLWQRSPPVAGKRDPRGLWRATRSTSTR